MNNKDTVRLSMEIPKDVHHRFKVAATVNGTSMHSVVMECVQKYLARQETPPDRTTETREDYKPGK
jgi:hypothetical protein